MQSQNLNIDLLVGKKICLRRQMLKMSQTTLGHALGISFQQIQKYEKGLNRVSAGRLMQISDILNVPVSFFMRISCQNNMPSPLTMKSSPAQRNICCSKDLERSLR
nr:MULTISPECIES: helix-turn-helix transcriptional regulator [Bartonella]